MIRNYRLALVVFLPLLLAACGNMVSLTPQNAGEIAERKFAEQGAEGLDTLALHNDAVRERNAGPVMNVPPRSGSGLVSELDVDSITTSRPERAGKDGRRPGARRVKLDFVDTSLKDIITVFMKDYLKAPYTFSDAFKDKKANLYFDAEATREETLALFDNLLDNYGVRLRFSGNTYSVVPSDDKSPIGVSPIGVGDVVAVIRLRFIDAKDFLPLAKQVVRDGNKLTALGTSSMVIASTSSDVRAVRLLAQELDAPVFAGKHILFYVPKYLTATSLVAMLDNYQNQLLGGQQAGSKQFETKQIAETDRIVIVAANRAARDLVVDFLAKTDLADRNNRQVFQYSLGSQTAADVAANLNLLLKSVFKNVSELAIVPDKTSNSLFIFASPDEFAEIRKLIERMDYRPPAVHIDMTIAEVRLNNTLQFGVDWFLRKKGVPLFELGSDQSLALTKGLRFAGLGGGDSVNFLVFELLGSETSFSLLSSPQLVVKNGATAKIAANTEQPIVKGKVTTGTTVQGNTAISSEVTYQKIGLELEVTPFVTNNNEVRMIIKLKDSTLAGNVKIDGNDYPRLSSRELSTELVTADRHTVFLGGIRRQTQSESRSKIPGAGDVTQWNFGALFGNKSDENDGAELIVLARPSIMLDQQGADIVTRAILNAAKASFQPFTEADNAAAALKGDSPARSPAP